MIDINKLKSRRLLIVSAAKHHTWSHYPEFCTFCANAFPKSIFPQGGYCGYCCQSSEHPNLLSKTKLVAKEQDDDRKDTGNVATGTKNNADEGTTNKKEQLPCALPSGSNYLSKYVSRPIPIPRFCSAAANGSHELLDHRATVELQEIYDRATWHMFHRITEYRRRKGFASCAVVPMKAPSKQQVNMDSVCVLGDQSSDEDSDDDCIFPLNLED